MQPITYFLDVKINPDRVISVDLVKELSIDLSNLHNEIREQPGKCAWWSVVEKLAEIKAHQVKSEMSHTGNTLREEYGSNDYLGDRRFKRIVVKVMRVQSQYLMLQMVKEAFEYKTGVLLSLVNKNQSQQDILERYNSSIKDLLWASGT